jgi:RNA polymerase sigma-70 factor (ECF subfamily)
MGTESDAAFADRELLALARRGDEGAIGLLVHRHSRPLHRYLVRLAGIEADDLLQETWLRVVERLDQHEADKPFKPWLYAIARNCAIDLHRRQARAGRAIEPWQEHEDPVEALPDAAPSALKQLTDAALRARVADLFPGLPRAYREALSLRYEDEMPIAEIAGLLKEPAATVKTRIHRGLAMLRRRLEEEP